MNESTVVIELRRALLAGLAAYGYADVPVIESGQRKKQGRVRTGLYYRLMNPRNVGWQARRYRPTEGDAGHTEYQLYEAMYQLTAVVQNDDETGYTSNDLASAAQMICQSLPFVEQVREKRLGVQRPSPIRSVPFVNERDNYETESSFDVLVSFVRSIAPATATVEAELTDNVRIQ